MRLPGGMPVWRGWWLVLRLAGLRLRAGPPPVPVTAAQHADLHELVQDAARRASLAPPRTVSLGGAARVRMRGHLLTVGLPLVWGLSAEQLRAVVAHEVALPPGGHRRLARELLHRRRHTDDTDFLLATRSLLDAAEQARDAAAIDAIGGGLAAVEDAALALFRAEAVRDAFERFAAVEAVRELGGERLRVADLHDGWRERLRRDGGPGTGWDPDVPLKRIPSEHPGLSGELLDVAEEADGYCTGLDPQAVPLDPLSPADLRILAGELGQEADGRWVDYAELPVEVYSDAVEQTARRHVEAVEALLGGPPADRDELVDVLLLRTREVCAAEGAASEPDPLTGASMVADLIEYTMIKRGWKRRHPAVARWMVSPAGVPVDVDAALHRPAELRRLLSGASAAAA